MYELDIAGQWACLQQFIQNLFKTVEVISSFNHLKLKIIQLT